MTWRPGCKIRSDADLWEAVAVLNAPLPTSTATSTPQPGMEPQDDETRRGIPADYDGDDPDLCNARTKSGHPCRALKLDGGRCKWHGGLSTGPRTPDGKTRALANLKLRWRSKGEND